MPGDMRGGQGMQISRERILTTHMGSLPRAESLAKLLIS